MFVFYSFFFSLEICGWKSYASLTILFNTNREPLDTKTNAAEKKERKETILGIKEKKSLIHPKILQRITYSISSGIYVFG